MELMLASILESTVANYLRTVLRSDDVRQLRSGPDFEIRKPNGKRIFLEVKGSIPSHESLIRLAKFVGQIDRPNAQFILITPKPPSLEEEKRFQKIFSKISVPCKWIDLQNLPAELETPSPGDFQSPKTLADLQIASLVSSIERYQGAPISSFPGVKAPFIDDQLGGLTRQFSHGKLNVLSKDPRPLEERLRLGQRVEQVTVVLSDVVNFSNLVSASRPEDLTEAMGRYYRLAREAVFAHGGMLDKFIGDAVLGVFGYPVPGKEDGVAAIKFAQDLISIGKEIFPRWLEELNAVIETGTRVGIATGDLWPINIGSERIEITLLGDTINLAARLEKNCTPDEMLIDNRTKSKVMRENPTFFSELNLTQIQIFPSDAKGQQFAIRAWATNQTAKNG